MKAAAHQRPSLAEPSAADRRRRELLAAAAGLVGAAGLLATAVPFVESLEPSEAARARGAPVEVDVGALAAGELRTVEWRGKPVWLMRRSDAMVRALLAGNTALADAASRRSQQPPACANATRSLRPDLFVALGLCTHLGCTPTLRLDDEGLAAELHAPGGFVCPCHGSRFDLAGRVLKNMPAPTNLEIPEHSLTRDRLVTIG